MNSIKDLAVQSYCFRGFKTNKEVIEKVKECGLGKIELCQAHVDFNDENNFENVVQEYKDAGINIVSIGVNRFQNDSVAEEKLFKFAKLAGCKVMSVSFAPDSVPESYPTAEKLADKYDINLGIHNHGARHWLGSVQMLKTVLANEQVISGECERCSTVVEQKKLKQWFFKITAYAQRLLDDIGSLDDWPSRVKIMQRNWIGRSSGGQIDFPLEGSSKKIKCFTTRLDTMYGATFLALSWDHPLIEELIRDNPNKAEIISFMEKIKNQPQSDRLADTFKKEGVFTGKYAVNPMNHCRLPIWIANYILAGYGTGAIMCVPAHDGRDFEFAGKYNLPVVEVIKKDRAERKKDSVPEQAYEGEGFLVNSGEFNGLSSSEAKEKIADYMEEHSVGRRALNYKLRDWLISRQRY